MIWREWEELPSVFFTGNRVTVVFSLVMLMKGLATGPWLANHLAKSNVMEKGVF